MSSTQTNYSCGHSEVNEEGASLCKAPEFVQAYPILTVTEKCSKCKETPRAAPPCRGLQETYALLQNPGNETLALTLQVVREQAGLKTQMDPGRRVPEMNAFERDYLTWVEKQIRQPSSEGFTSSNEGSRFMEPYVNQAMSDLRVNIRAEYQSNDIHRRATSPNYANHNPDVPRLSCDSETNIIFRGQKMVSDAARAEIDQRKGLTLVIPQIARPAPVEITREPLQSEDQAIASQMMQKSLKSPSPLSLNVCESRDSQSPPQRRLTAGSSLSFIEGDDITDHSDPRYVANLMKDFESTFSIL